MKIVYLGHSGFAVKTASRTLVFDCVADDLPEPPNALTFVSHAHGDHWGGAACLWHGPLFTGGFNAGRGTILREGDTLTCDGARIEAFGSTDEGVSFLVDADGYRVFHAGDYNFWHWRDESTPEEVAAAEKEFRRILDTIAGRRVDVAFFPVDPRMGAGYAEGAAIFLDAVRPGVLIPMHFWNKPDAAVSFAREHPGVRAMTRKGESIVVKRGEDGYVYVQPYKPERDGYGQEPALL